LGGVVFTPGIDGLVDHMSLFKKSSTKFHIKVRKLWKALFKRSLERNCKSKNVLEFEVEKEGTIFFV
jgi:hypothetical protein